MSSGRFPSTMESSEPIVCVFYFNAFFRSLANNIKQTLESMLNDIGT